MILIQTSEDNVTLYGNSRADDVNWFKISKGAAVGIVDDSAAFFEILAWRDAMSIPTEPDPAAPLGNKVKLKEDGTIQLIKPDGEVYKTLTGRILHAAVLAAEPQAETTLLEK